MQSCEKSADMKGKEGHKTTHCHRERGTEDTSGEEEEESRREGGMKAGSPDRPEQESKELESSVLTECVGRSLPQPETLFHLQKTWRVKVNK